MFIINTNVYCSLTVHNIFKKKYIAYLSHAESIRDTSATENCLLKQQERSLNPFYLGAHSDLDHSVFVSIFEKFFCFDFVLYSLSFIGSRDFDHQWPALHNQNKNIVSVQNQNKQRILGETFKNAVCCKTLKSFLYF